MLFLLTSSVALAGTAVETPAAVEATTTAYAVVAAESNAQLSAATLLRFEGDARYRYEAIDAAGPAYDRHRIRMRFGVDALVTPTTHAVLKLSTGDGDPRSAHLTFSGGYSRKSIGVDLAYLEWRPDSAWAVSAGKIPYPTWRPAQSLFIGGDFNPEGIASGYRGDSGLFASAYTFWLADRGSQSDSRQHGAQLGYARKSTTNDWSVAVSYNDFAHVQGAFPFLDGVSAYGNSVNPDGSLASEFEIADIAAQWAMETYPGSWTLFAHAAHNTRALRGADAYAAGLAFAPARSAYDWRASYQYARVGQDSLFGQLLDGDFGGGVTDTRGHVFRLAYTPAPRVNATLSYLHNDVARGAPEQHGHRLLQLDIDLSF